MRSTVLPSSRLARTLTAAALPLLALASCRDEPTQPARSAVKPVAATASLTTNGSTDLGTLGGSYSYATDANGNGTAVGHSTTAAGDLHGFIARHGAAMTDLGTLGGTFAYAFGINGSEQVVGYSGTADNAAQHAFLWKDGAMTDLGTLGGAYSEAYDVNDAGQVVGNSYVAGDAEIHAYRWDKGAMTDLGTLGGSYSFATAINATGDVVGYSYDASNSAPHAFLWRNGTMTDLGTLGGTASFAFGINSAGQVVGYSYTAEDAAVHPFLWQNGTMTDLGTLGGGWGYALGINDAGQVTGWSGTSAGEQHVFVWAEGSLTDLGPSSGAGEARAISGMGQVAGASSASGDWHATLWSVQAPNQAPVIASVGGPYAAPEGTTVALAVTASDPDGDALSWAWDLDGDGTYAPGAATASFTPPDEGSYTVAVRVTDARGATASASITVTASNVAPTARLGLLPGASVDEGSPYTLQLTDARDVAADQAELRYAFDCGDGRGYGAFGDATSASCATTDNGWRHVSAKVRDADGGETEYRDVVEVVNVAPTVTGASFPGPLTLRGKSVSGVISNVAGTDPAVDADAPYTQAIDCGNGTLADQNGLCTWTDVGTYTVKVTVSDKDGGVSAPYIGTVIVDRGRGRPTDKVEHVNQGRALGRQP